SELCVLRKISDHYFSVECGEEQILIESDPRFEIDSFEGSNKPISGWVSRGYHRKIRSTTLVVRCPWYEHLETEIRFIIGEQNPKRTHRVSPKVVAKVTAS